MAAAYIKLKRGGWLKVPDYDAFAYSDPTIYIGYWRATGWIPNQLPEYSVITVGASDVLMIQPVSPATGTTTVPDEQAHTPPRTLSWPETRLTFTLAGRTVAQVFWKDIVSWSNVAPTTS